MNLSPTLIQSVKLSDAYEFPINISFDYNWFRLLSMTYAKIKNLQLSLQIFYLIRDPYGTEFEPFNRGFKAFGGNVSCIITNWVF